MIPSSRPDRKLHEREAVQETVALVVALVGFAIAAVTTYVGTMSPGGTSTLALALLTQGPDREAMLRELSRPSGPDPLTVVGWIATLAGIVLLFAFRLAAARRKDLLADQTASPEGLRGCAHVLRSILLGTEELAGDDTLRVTVYRVGDEHVEQVIDYVGAGEPSGIGRRFPIQCGIVGFAARTGQTLSIYRVADEEADYRRELVENWGYTVAAANRLSGDRWSFLAVPIAVAGGRVIDVIYADSSRRGVFSDTAQLIIDASVGYGAYIMERYR